LNDAAVGLLQLPPVVYSRRTLAGGATTHAPLTSEPTSLPPLSWTSTGAVAPQGSATVPYVVPLMAMVRSAHGSALPPQYWLMVP
jgi:hypothetical protein